MLLVVNAVDGGVTGDRLDPPEVRTDRLLAHDLDRADEPERVDVRAATELHRVIAGFEDANEVAVLLTEERDRPDRFGVLTGRLVVADGRVGDDLAIRERFDTIQLTGGHRLEVAEVEAKPVRRDQRARLLHMGPEYFAQRPVENVGRGVVAPDAVASLGVDRGGDAVAFGELAARDFGAVQDERARDAVLRVEDAQLRAAVSGREDAGVAHLTAGLGVERRAV